MQSIIVKNVVKNDRKIILKSFIPSDVLEEKIELSRMPKVHVFPKKEIEK